MSGKDIKPNRGILTQELRELTGGDALQALFLRQLIYWCVRLPEDRLREYLDEEDRRRTDPSLNKAGWFYKSAPELAEETESGVHPRTVRRRVKALVEGGWVEEGERQSSFDRTKTYRVDLLKIQRELLDLRYSLKTVMTADKYKLIKHFISDLKPASEYNPDDPPANDSSANDSSANDSSQEAEPSTESDPYPPPLFDATNTGPSAYHQAPNRGKKAATEKKDLPF